MRRFVGRLAGHRTPLVVDAAVALFLFVYTVTEIISGSGSTGDLLVLHLAGATLITLPLALRRIVPWVAAVAFLAGILLHSMWSAPINSFGEFAAAMLVAYSLAAHATRQGALVGGLAFVTAIAVFLVRDPLTRDILDAFATVVVLVAFAGIGLVVRRRRREVDHRTRTAATDERTRIARELHDLVGHAVSLMTVQAGVARVALDADDGDRAAQALTAVETAGRQALDELRRVLGMLGTADDDTGDGLGPQPGLGAITDLIDQHRRAGLPVALEIHGEPRPVPAGIELCLYRVVQESLTNVRKHAGAPPTDVALRYGPEVVEVSVRDQGVGPRTRGRDGHGIAGMRDRVALYGGTFHARGSPDGGFVVEASVPAVATVASGDLR